LVFQYAQNYYQYKKEGNNQSIIEMKKYIGAMKLAGSEHIAKTYETHLKKLIEENS
jgi:positive transcriptional regulator mutR family